LNALPKFLNGSLPPWTLIEAISLYLCSVSFNPGSKEGWRSVLTSLAWQKLVHLLLFLVGGGSGWCRARCLSRIFLLRREVLGLCRLCLAWAWWWRWYRRCRTLWSLVRFIWRGAGKRRWLDDELADYLDIDFVCKKVLCSKSILVTFSSVKTMSSSAPLLVMPRLCRPA